MKPHQRSGDVGLLAQPDRMGHPPFLQRPPLPLLTRFGRASLMWPDRNGLPPALARRAATALLLGHVATPVATATR